LLLVWLTEIMKTIYLLIHVVEGIERFSHDFTAAILVFQNNETAAMLVYQDNPVGVEFFS